LLTLSSDFSSRSQHSAIEPHSMTVARSLRIPPNPHTASSASITSTVSGISPLFLRSSVRGSRPDDTPRQTSSRTVRWSTHVEVFRQPARTVSWSAQVEVFIIPARERTPHQCDPRFQSTTNDCAPDDCSPPCVVSAKDRAQDDCASRASTTPNAAAFGDAASPSPDGTPF